MLKPSAGSLFQQNRRRDDGGPPAPFVAHGGLCDVHGADDLVGDAVDFLLLVPARVGIEVHVERGGQHFGREFLRVVPRDLLALAKAVVLGQVAVNVRVARNGHAHRRRDQAMRFPGRRLGHHHEGHLARLQALDALRAIAVGLPLSRSTHPSGNGL